MEAKSLINTIDLLMLDECEQARQTILDHYSFSQPQPGHRKYTDLEKMEIYFRDGFVDRYSGDLLVNPGILKTLTYFFPDDFPYHPHWKIGSCHSAYWKLLPTVDHIIPVAYGGGNSKENLITTSMRNNAIKSNWTLEELRWSIHKPGVLNDWDGLTAKFIAIAESHPEILSDSYIKKWYRLSKKFV